MTKVCYPDYVVTDGVAAMEGFGPSGGTRGVCSACHAAMVQLFRYHHQEYENGPEATLVFGRAVRRSPPRSRAPSTPEKPWTTELEDTIWNCNF